MAEPSDKEKKIVDNLLGRQTYIVKPISVNETQYLDLQKSKKYKVDMISPDKHLQNFRRGNFDPKKNTSLLSYPTYKSLQTSCQKVSNSSKFLRLYGLFRLV